MPGDSLFARVAIYCKNCEGAQGTFWNPGKQSGQFHCFVAMIDFVVKKSLKVFHIFLAFLKMLHFTHVTEGFPAQALFATLMFAMFL